MELEALYAAPAHAGRNLGPVIADGGNDGRIIGHRMEAVDELHILPVRFLHQRGRIHRRDPVPSHMGDLVSSDDFLHLALEIA